MGLERTRKFLLSLRRCQETLQWDKLVYWVMDKRLGGKMYAMLEPEPGGTHVLAFAAPPDDFHMLLEIEGVRPAPYLARAHWVVVERWDVFTERELHEHLCRAYEQVASKLPLRKQRLLELPLREYRAMLRDTARN